MPTYIATLARQARYVEDSTPAKVPGHETDAGYQRVTARYSATKRSHGTPCPHVIQEDPRLRRCGRLLESPRVKEW